MSPKTPSPKTPPDTRPGTFAAPLTADSGTHDDGDGHSAAGPHDAPERADRDRLTGDRSAPYPEVPRVPDFPAIELRVLRRWRDEGTFAASVDQRPADSEYVFYDGPPFANGLPHHGHLLTGYVKDVIPRYRTMRGHRVNRRFGWDCHGLPAEMEAERELGVSGRAAIGDFGVRAFNEHCRNSVLRYTSEWETTVTRQARWVDFENDYKTMDLPYMESVMWAFKRLYEQGLIYEAYRVMPYSWGAETPLSNFEIRLDDATRPRQDPAVTVWFETPDGPGGLGPLRLLAWTTTPWTLPSNLAVAVGPDVQYAVIETATDPCLRWGAGQTENAQNSAAQTESRQNSTGPFRWVLAADLAERYRDDLGPDAEVVATLPGRALEGCRYTPLFDFYAERDEAFVVIAAAFVDTSEGTGIVHLAPGFGEDDQTACEAAGIPIGRAVPVDDHGRFTEAVPPWAGENVFDANDPIIAHLKRRGRVLRHDSYEHNYPHCWRTDTPVIYRAVSSWYVKVTDIRDRLCELNERINWVPSHVSDGRFGQWLAGARDWSISRNRFWGSPIPVWRSDDPNYPRIDVYGSLDELEADFGRRPADLHRPGIDELTRPNPDDPTGRSTMRRVPEVLDCWFESGSMPFAQVHYPFENEEWFTQNFPADFIVEYINQTRGWFYTLHVLAGALFDLPAFQNVICHGVLLAADGSKLSKRLRNYTEPEEIFATQGADALRWYLMSSGIVRGGDARISDDGIAEVARRVLLPIWNAYGFFALYANVEGYRARHRTDSTHLLDRYLLAKTRMTLEAVTDRLDRYDLPGAAAQLTGFLHALNNWYIRRSRERFWGVSGRCGTDGTDGTSVEPTDTGIDTDAFDTLGTVLSLFVTMAAPLMPLIAEEIHGGLHDGSSVHLQDWPDPQELPAAPELVAAMDLVRDAASAALRIREDAGLRVRLPLAAVRVIGPGAAGISKFAGLTELLADEINVRSVVFSEDLSGWATPVLRPNGSVLGPRLGPAVQAVFAAAREGRWEHGESGSLIAGGHELRAGEYDLTLTAVDDATTAVLAGRQIVVVLDTDVTPEQEAEGAARDLIRQIQQTRKDADLAVTDRIDLVVRWSTPDLDAVKDHQAAIARAVLAVSVDWQPGGDTPTVELTRRN